MPISVKLEGTKGVQNVLKEFRNDTFKKKVLTAAYRKAGKPFVKLARANAPVADDYVFRKNGDAIAPETLKKSIGTWTYRKIKSPHLLLGARQGRRSLKYDGWFYRFPEFGTVHQAPKPFLKPAWNSTIGMANGIVSSEFTGIFNKFKSKYNL